MCDCWHIWTYLWHSIMYFIFTTIFPCFLLFPFLHSVDSFTPTPIIVSFEISWLQLLLTNLIPFFISDPLSFPCLFIFGFYVLDRGRGFSIHHWCLNHHLDLEIVFFLNFQTSLLDLLHSTANSTQIEIFSILLKVKKSLQNSLFLRTNAFHLWENRRVTILPDLPDK